MWAVVATILGLISTGLVVFLFFQLRAGRTGSPQRAGWLRWEVSAGGNGHWYKAVALTNDVTWTEAERLARLEGGYLATITSVAETRIASHLSDTRSSVTRSIVSPPNRPDLIHCRATPYFITGRRTIFR